MVPPSSDSARHPRSNAWYWVESRKPLASLLLITPLLIAYEISILALGPGALRNGADVWLRGLLNWVGFGQYFLLPVMTICILLGWHHTTRQSWRLSGNLIWGMALECVVLAVCLRLILQLQRVVIDLLAVSLSPLRPSDVSLNLSEMVRGVAGYLGAGVYEELLFRLILLSLTVWLLRHLGVRKRSSNIVATLATSLVFAAAHYIGPFGDRLDLQTSQFWFGLMFRFLAGVFFCVLFVFRGFGIAAGTHAGYDILVGIWKI